MRKPQNITAGIAVTLLITLLVLLLPVATFNDSTSYADRLSSGPGGHGCAGGNLIPNCGLDNPVPVPQGYAPAGWTPYVLSGSLAMDPSPDTYWGAPSLRMWSDGGTFTAGIYTQVGGVSPGNTYYASMGWGAPTPPQDSWARRLGIDPTGGTDPNSPNVVWGPTHRGPGKVMNDSNRGGINIDVSAVARAATVTVFVWVEHNYSTGQNEIFVDAVGLYQSAAAPVAVPTDTPKPVPPPATAASAARAAPTRPKSTATTPPTSTPSPTASATPSPTSSPSVTPTATATATPSDTPTPSVTPSSTLPPRPRATASQDVAAQAEVSSVTTPPQGLLYGGIGALLGAGLLGVVVVVRRRR